MPESPLLTRLILALWCVLVPAAALAQSAVDSADAPSAETAEPADRPAQEPAVDDVPEDDPCQASYLDPKSWVDWFNLRIHNTVCDAAHWFDSLFGDRAAEAEREATYGRLYVGLNWDETRGLEDDIRFRARMSFPNAERKLEAFVGRDDREEVVTDSDSRRPIPSGFQPYNDDEWLVGLGYSPLRSTRNRLSFDLGVDLDFPVNPFISAKYRHQYFPSEQTMIRFRHVFFWEDEDGMGSSHRLDLERVLAPGVLLRWRNAATHSNGTLGVDWFSELTLYHQIGTRRALGYRIGSTGETDRPVRIERHFLRLIYRQSIFREWLFLEIAPGVAFHRDLPGASREALPLLRFGVEMLFGDPALQLRP